MAVPTLPLVFIGWLYAIASFAALTLGVVLLQQLFRSGKIPPEYLQTRIVGDFVLLLVWAIGLASAFALLNGYAWGRTGLEYFCYVLIALTLLSGAARIAAHGRLAQGGRLARRSWIPAMAGVLLVAVPLIALCVVTIHSLRSS